MLFLDSAPRTAHLGTKITAAEHRALGAAAQARGVTVSRLVRAALAAELAREPARVAGETQPRETA